MKTHNIDRIKKKMTLRRWLYEHSPQSESYLRKFYDECEELHPVSEWLPIETAPKDGRYIIVASDSGYTTTPLRAEVCRYDSEYKPLQPWVNHANDSFLDGGSEPPIYWMPLPDVIKTKKIKIKEVISHEEI